MQEDQLDFSLSEKQIEAFEHPAQFLLYGGAKGGGKSWFLCIWVFLKAIENPGNKIFFFRKRAVDFINTTLQTWKKVIPPQYYTINENKRKIFVHDSGSEIDYGGLDDEADVQKLNSAEYGNGAIDQAEEVSRDAFGMCRGTLRHRLKDGKFPDYHVRLSANPAQCWLIDAFINHPEKDFAYVKALPTDNPGLPQSYIENLKEAYKHRPAMYKALVEGSWEIMAGGNLCIHPTHINEAKHVKAIGPAIKRVVVNDPSHEGDDENVTYVVERTESHYRIVDTLFMNHKTGPETAAHLQIMRKKWSATDIFIDKVGVGASAYDQLMLMGEPVTGIISQSKDGFSKSDSERFLNLRAKMWMDAGDKFATGMVELPNDDVLISQLGQMTFEVGNGNKIKVLSKKEVKKAIQQSPDRADAMVYALHCVDVADRLDAQEYRDAIADIQGRGTEINPYQDVDDLDYTGYNM